jgi:hypothetical protein
MRVLNLLIPSMLSILVAGAPGPEANAEPSPEAERNTESRANHARFGYSGGDTCTGPVYQFDSTGGCYPVASSARSIYIYENAYVLSLYICPLPVDFFCSFHCLDLE